MQKENWLWILVILLVFILGLAVRFYDLKDAPLDFHPTRQLHSALMARGMYYQSLKDAPQWKKDLAYSQWQAEGLIEPQIMQTLAALTYRLLGSEQLWVPRVWSIFFWLLGALFLFFLALEISSIRNAAAALAVFFLWPYAAIASRAFQPESLLTAATLAALWAAVRWNLRRTKAAAFLAGILCGMAIYVKSVAIFFLAPPVALFALSGSGIRQAFRDRQLWMIALLSLLPYVFYYIYGVYGLGKLSSQFTLRFFPGRWMDPVFYLQWLSELNRVFPLWFLIPVLLGSWFIIPKKLSGLLAGFVMGYLIYGLVFSYHITTHDYYHLPLIIPLSLGAGFLFSAMLELSDRSKSVTAFSGWLILVFLCAWNAWQVRTELKRNSYQKEILFWQDLGERLGHDKHVIGLLPDYGFRLAYWGWMNVSAWTTQEDIELREMAGQIVDLEKAIQTNLSEADYFVVTEMAEFIDQPVLVDFLQENYRKTEDSPSLAIFDLNQKRGQD